MQYGFVIDHERCIGCHACTVACKAENDVPVGSFRTSVKYVERGTFPEIRRHFAVQRCNHCTDAPCVTICPVKALHKRDDGIVDLDRDACIGCRACMQACPYDAIYLNDDSGAAEKCHFCAHRVERSLEPACVTVCPVNAIIPGDLDDPESRAGRLVGERETSVRRPEQGTGPNVHYIGIDESALKPGAAVRPEQYLWSDRPPDKPEPWPVSLPVLPNARVVLDAGHRVEWGWHVALYLVTKGIAAGAGLLAPFAAWLGLKTGFADLAPEVIALVFTAVTCVLLVGDLARPARFYRLLTRPNFDSWLVRGGIILAAFGVLAAGALAARLAEMMPLANGLRVAVALVAIAVAGYTALLFAQCRGRNLWNGRLLGPHLVAQAVMCGAACLLPFAPGDAALKLLFTFGAGLHLAFALAERYGGHETDNARQAAAFLTVVRLGPLRAYREGLLLGVAASLVLLLVLPAAVPATALIGLYLYEHAYVRAAQLPPLS